MAGRKSKYDEIVKPNLTLVEGWARDGMLEKDIAAKLNIAMSTLSEYKLKHEELAEALKRNKEIADYEVENSLFKKCVGCYAKEQKAFKCKEVYYDENGNRCENEIVKVVDVDVFVPPDTTAIAIWLNNRRPQSWRRNANKERLDEQKFAHDKNIDDRKYW